MSESLIATINRDISAAMRAQDRRGLAPLRMLKAALVNRRVEKRSELTDEEALKIVSTLVKQRRDSVDQFTKAGRSELAAAEANEIDVLEHYLPPPIDSGSLADTIESVIDEIGATSPKDLGAVMKQVMAKLAGQRVDGKTVSQLVRSKLGG